MRRVRWRRSKKQDDVDDERGQNREQEDQQEQVGVIAGGRVGMAGVFNLPGIHVENRTKMSAATNAFAACLATCLGASSQISEDPSNSPWFHRSRLFKTAQGCADPSLAPVARRQALTRQRRPPLLI